MASYLPRPTKSERPCATSTGFLCTCLLCQRGFVHYQRKTTWNTILRVIFYSLKQLEPHKEYVHLTNDIYVFIAQHHAVFSKLKHCLRPAH